MFIALVVAEEDGEENPQKKKVPSSDIEDAEQSLDKYNTYVALSLQLL